MGVQYIIYEWKKLSSLKEVYEKLNGNLNSFYFLLAITEKMMFQMCFQELYIHDKYAQRNTYLNTQFTAALYV